MKCQKHISVINTFHATRKISRSEVLALLGGNPLMFQDISERNLSVCQKLKLTISALRKYALQFLSVTTSTRFI